MLRLNRVSRFDLADIAVQRVAHFQPNHSIALKAHELSSYWQHQLVGHAKYIEEAGEDPSWCSEIEEVKR